MRNLIFLLFIVLCSCDTDDDILMNIPCSEENCKILNPFNFNVTPDNESLIITYGQSVIVDAFEKVCIPDALDFYISENNDDFIKVKRVFPSSGNFTIEGLDDGKEYFIKMVNKHCELDSIVAPIQSLIVKIIPLPILIDNNGKRFEDFRLSPDGNQFIYRSINTNNWYLSSLSNPQAGVKIIDDAFYAKWNPNSNTEISFVQDTKVNILPNLQGSTSKYLKTINITTNHVTVLHEIEHLYEFQNEHKPEQYWIHEFHYSINGTDIYFTSNKDNGSSNNLEKNVFNNIWKLDLATGSIESLSDFLPDEFEIRDFIEDPRNLGNFYITGSTYGEKIMTEGPLFNSDRIDIHYYNSVDKTIKPIFISDYQENHISVDPRGDNLIYVSNRSGNHEIWCYNLSSHQVKQITNGATYSPTFGWQHLNWISDTEFMTYVRHEGDFKFAIFKIE